MKKFLSFVLAFVLLLTCVPAVPAQATEVEEIHEEVFLEEPITEETEPPVAEETEAPVTEETEPPATEETEPPATEETEPPVTEETESPVTEETEPVVEEVAVSEPAMMAVQTTEDGFQYEIVDNATVTITGYTGTATELVTPSEIEGKPVNAIGPYAFKSCWNITQIDISEGVTHIGEMAFNNCTQLREIIIPQTVRTIDTLAFSACTMLQSVTIPEGVTELADQLFRHCHYLNEVILPDGLLTIGQNVFSQCEYLEEVIIPGTVTTIANNAFESCTALKHIEIPDSVTSLGANAFDYCYQLTDVVIGNGVTCIEENTFARCARLVKLTIGKGVQQIKENAFYQCNALHEVNLVDLAAWLRVSADNNSSPLCTYDSRKNLYINGELVTDLVIPEGTEIIPAYAFASCSNIQSVTIPASVKEIGEWAFTFCYQLSDIYLEDLRAWTEAGEKYSDGFVSDYVPKRLFLKGEHVTTLKIPDGIEKIGAYAFAHMTQLEQIEIPDSVKQIDWYAFLGCSGLTTMYFGSGLEIVDDIFCTGLIGGTNRFESCKSLVNFCVKDMASWINLAAASGYHNPLKVNENQKFLYVDGELVSKAEIPESVTKIPDKAFYEFSQITEVSMPESVTEIGSEAFAYCANLENATVPGTVTALGSGAFRGCENLKDFQIPEKLTVIQSNTFDGCKKLENLVIPGSVTEIGEQAFLFCSGLKEIIIPDSVTKIGRQAFGACAAATVLYIGTGVEEIGGGAFIECENLVNVYIPDNVKSVGSYLFSGCSNLETAAWGRQLLVIGEGAFNKCPNLKCVAVPKSVKYIYAYAFEHSENLHCMVYEGTYEELQQIQVKVTANDPIFEVDWHLEGTCCQPIVTIKRDSETGFPRISWKEEPCILAYAIYRATSADGDYEFLDVTYDLSYVDETAAYGKKNYYVVVGISDFGVGGEPSKEKSITTSCAPPILTPSTNSSGYPLISWEKVSGAKEYQIYYSETEDGTYTKLATTTKTSYTHSKAAAGKGYYYKVKTIGSSSALNSVFSEPVYAARKLGQPALTVTVDAAGKPVITWKAIANAIGYELQVKCNDGEFQTLVTTEELKFVHEDVAVGNAYTYRAKALSEVEALTGDYCSEKTVNIKCGKPVMTLSNDPITGKPILSWDAVDGAQQYQIYYAASKDGKFKLLAETKDLTYTHEAASAGKTCYYKVRAVDGNGVAGAYCSVKSAVCKCLAPTITSATSNSSGYPYIKWNKVSGAKKYEVYYAAEENGTYKKLTTTSSTSYTHSKASAGKGYFYKVRAYGSSTSSAGAFSETVFAVRQLGKPAVTAKLNSTARECKLTWKKITGATGYDVQVKINDGQYQSLGSTTKLTFTHTELDVGADYTYRVIALCDLEAANGISSGKTVHIKCGKPVITAAADPVSGKPVVSWEAVEGAAAYEVYYATSKSGTYKKLGTVETAEYVHSAATAGKKYYYKVRAVDELGVKGAYSSIKNTTCKKAQLTVE